MLPNTYDPDCDSVGVKHDTLVDARIEIDDTAYQLQDAYVALDSAADDMEGIWTEDERREIRQMQRTLETLTDVCEENIGDINDELDTLDYP